MFDELPSRNHENQAERGKREEDGCATGSTNAEYGILISEGIEHSVKRDGRSGERKEDFGGSFMEVSLKPEPLGPNGLIILALFVALFSFFTAFGNTGIH